ncbi:uncharacterized protein HMPREF1541_06525 [Cyphellophora europaea CBS 101466]|uniref:Uncharacterized protein n=1 Tax=Cyphellophora europaea (strain CBS 101466) TaxID=1220924 RepID=W2RQA1_CYPE1|nr:uncharacterized protein HMPREF1541_06525 [Cyphellophora europaea CBS 101466]ETN38490.1 hypothetical protein HMPREF1541_06525 [Cyphellophora europaea CBS 101466]
MAQQVTGAGPRQPSPRPPDESKPRPQLRIISISRSPREQALECTPCTPPLVRWSPVWSPRAPVASPSHSLTSIQEYEDEFKGKVRNGPKLVVFNLENTDSEFPDQQKPDDLYEPFPSDLSEPSESKPNTWSANSLQKTPMEFYFPCSSAPDSSSTSSGSSLHSSSGSSDQSSSSNSTNYSEDSIDSHFKGEFASPARLGYVNPIEHPVTLTTGIQRSSADDSRSVESTCTASRPPIPDPPRFYANITSRGIQLLLGKPLPPQLTRPANSNTAAPRPPNLERPRFSAKIDSKGIHLPLRRCRCNSS